MSGDGVCPLCAGSPRARDGHVACVATALRQRDAWQAIAKVAMAREARAVDGLAVAHNERETVRRMLEAACRELSEMERSDHEQSGDMLKALSPSAWLAVLNEKARLGDRP